MPGKVHNYLLFLGVLTVVFITVGDLFLPKPLNNYSQNTRTTITKYLVSLFPQKQPKRPSGQRENQVRELEKGVSSPASPSR